MTLQETLKSRDTEEWIDLVFYRPIGYYWALFFKRINVTPNAVSILSIFLGVAAGVLFYYPNLGLNSLGMVLLIWANTYDSADGQLARMTNNYSRLGRLLDGLASNCWFVTIYFAIGFRLSAEWGIAIWVLAVITGYFHIKQAAMADYLRNFHLLFIKDNKKSEFDDAAKLKQQMQKLEWKTDFSEKALMMYYANYTESQEKWTPKLQAFRRILGDSFLEANRPTDRTETKAVGDFGQSDHWDTLKEEFRKASKPMMKYTNILSFNTRVMALFICLITGYPWVYFLFELTVLNSVLLYMLFKYEAICEMFTFRLRGND